MDSHAESFDFISRNIQSNSPSPRINDKRHEKRWGSSKRHRKDVYFKDTGIRYNAQFWPRNHVSVGNTAQVPQSFA